MNVLVMNCSPVHGGATATFAEMVRSRIASRHKVKCVCIGDDAFAFCMISSLAAVVFVKLTERKERV